jgi:predicted GH43/DUF377 family glycosyl hydrolase
MSHPIVRRYENNPILRPKDVPYAVETVHNAGVAKYDDRYIMLFRSHKQNGRSIIGRADSRDGYQFQVKQDPFLVPAEEGIFAEYEKFGVEDLRICPFEDHFLLCYSAYSDHGVRIALARTENFETVERVALISQADMRNAVIFPEKIGDRYVRLDRPHTQIHPWSIWISYANELEYWGESKKVFSPLPYHWDEMKVGPGAPPIKTDKGWLNIYHGAFKTMDGAIYRLGVALHELSDPSKIIGIADSWILSPKDPWEISGYVSNIVFTCGAVPEPDGSVKIYWGGADSVMCVGTAKLDELVELCIENPRQ